MSRPVSSTRAASSASSSGEAPAAAAPPRPVGRPRKLPEDEARRRVLEAATTVFAAEGYDDATSDRIAERSGIPRPTIYRLFGSKEGVFVAAVDRALDRIIEHQTASLRSTTNLQGRAVVSVNVAAFLELVSREPETIRMLQLADTRGSGTKARAAESRRRMEKAVADYVRATWNADRPLSEKEADLGARLVVALVESAAIHFLEGDDYDAEELAAYLSNFIRTGFTFLRERGPS